MLLQLTNSPQLDPLKNSSYILEYMMKLFALITPVLIMGVSSLPTKDDGVYPYNAQLVYFFHPGCAVLDIKISVNGTTVKVKFSENDFPSFHSHHSSGPLVSSSLGGEHSIYLGYLL